MINKEKLYEEIEFLQKVLEKQVNAYEYEKTFDEKYPLHNRYFRRV